MTSRSALLLLTPSPLSASLRPAQTTLVAIATLERMRHCALVSLEGEPDSTMVDIARAWLDRQAAKWAGLSSVMPDLQADATDYATAWADRQARGWSSGEVALITLRRSCATLVHWREDDLRGPAHPAPLQERNAALLREIDPISGGVTAGLRGYCEAAKLRCAFLALRKNTTLCGAEQMLTPLTRACPPPVSCSGFGWLALQREHETVALFSSPADAAVSRWQRAFVAVTTILIAVAVEASAQTANQRLRLEAPATSHLPLCQRMSGRVLRQQMRLRSLTAHSPPQVYIFWRRGVSCCGTVRSLLGCSADVDEPCRGFQGACGSLVAQFSAFPGSPIRGFECSAYPHTVRKLRRRTNRWDTWRVRRENGGV